MAPDERSDSVREADDASRFQQKEDDEQDAVEKVGGVGHRDAGRARAAGEERQRRRLVLQ